MTDSSDYGPLPPRRVLRDARDRSVLVPFEPHPPEYTDEQWAARVRRARQTLVRVLLRERERLIAEGELPAEAPTADSTPRASMRL